MASSEPAVAAELKKTWLTKTRSWPPERAAEANRSPKLSKGSAGIRSTATRASSSRRATWRGQLEHGGDAALHARNQFAEDRLPFVVGQPCGIGERLAMRRARRVRPEMMAVCREMNASRLRGAKLGEMPAQIERHRSLGCAV